MSPRRRWLAPVLSWVLLGIGAAATVADAGTCIDYAEVSPYVTTIPNDRAITDVLTIGDRLFAVAEFSRTVEELDISDPQAPVTLGLAAITEGHIKFAELTGDLLVLSGPTAGQGYVAVVDVSVPGSPVEYASEAIGEGAVDAMAVEGDRLWITVNGRVQLFEIGGTGLTSLGFFTLPDHPFALASAGARVWTASATHVRLVSFDDPSNPAEVVSYEHAAPRSGERGVSTTPRTLLHVGSYLILGRNDAGLILDVSDLLDIHMIWSIGRATYGVAFAEDLFFRHATSILRYDVSTPSSPALLAAYDSGFAAGMSVDGDRLLVAAFEEGIDVIGLTHSFLDPIDVVSVPDLGESFLDGSHLYVLGDAGSPILDVSDPAAITQVGSVPFDADVLVSDGVHWYARHQSSRVSIYDWDGSESATLLGTWMSPGHWEATDLWPGEDGLLYVLVSQDADFETWPWIHVLDVSDPTSIETIDVISVGGTHATELTWAHERLWVKSSERLSVFDLTDPEHPVLTAHVATGAEYDEFPVIDRGGNIIFDGSLAFVADGAGGVTTFDVTDPDSPVLVGSSEGLPGINQVRVQDGILYARSYRQNPAAGGGIEVLDVHDPTTPVLIGSHRLATDVSGLFAVGGHLLASGRGGTAKSVTVLPGQCAVSVDVGVAEVVPAHPMRARPNPFRTRTTLPLDIDVVGVAELAVFDVSGREIHRSTREVAAGAIRLTWDGTDHLGRAVPAGVYFLDVTAPGHESRSRVVRVER